MLVEFQQALADLTASPDLCNAVRADPAVLAERYELTERERRRLIGIANHRGMAAACAVYRMNRLAPMALNLRGTIHALGPALRALVDAYWREYPRGHAHFYIECDRFAGWLLARVAAGADFPAAAVPILEREAAAVRRALATSWTVEPGPPVVDLSPDSHLS